MLSQESEKTELLTYGFGTFLIHKVEKPDPPLQPNQLAYR